MANIASFDYLTSCGLLRLDIRSDYEVLSKIIKILRWMMEQSTIPILL